MTKKFVNTAQTRMRWLPAPREHQVQTAIVHAFELLRHKVLLFRNNTGAHSEEGRWIQYGLGVGGADLVGLVSTGRFLALELKREKMNPTPQQREWLAAITKMGGYACVVRSVEEALHAVNEALAGKPSPPLPGDEP